MPENFALEVFEWFSYWRVNLGKTQLLDKLVGRGISQAFFCDQNKTLKSGQPLTFSLDQPLGKERNV